MEKKIESTNAENIDKKLIISDVMVSVLSDDNVEQFKTELNTKMKLLFGVDNWIGYGKFNLVDYYGMNTHDVEKIISYIDRDYEA